VFILPARKLFLGTNVKETVTSPKQINATNGINHFLFILEGFVFGYHTTQF
jgi:hypothetical protein